MPGLSTAASGSDTSDLTTPFRGVVRSKVDAVRGEGTRTNIKNDVEDSDATGLGRQSRSTSRNHASAGGAVYK
jgi:hypothetical protein